MIPLEMAVRDSPCSYCARKHRGSGYPPSCDAFPDGIPEEILTGENDHTRPYPGDHGLRWAVADDAPASVKAANRPFPAHSA